MNYSTHKSRTIVYIFPIFIHFLPPGTKKYFFKTIHISRIPIVYFSSTYIFYSNDKIENILVHKI